MTERAEQERTKHVASVAAEFRAFFVANYLDGDDTGGMVTARANRLADDIEELFAVFTEEMIDRERAKFAKQFTGSASSITPSDPTMQTYNAEDSVQRLMDQLAKSVKDAREARDAQR